MKNTHVMLEKISLLTPGAAQGKDGRMSDTLAIPISEERARELVQAIAKREHPAAGAALRELRESAGMTLSQAASLFHRKGPTWCGWEQGDAWPPDHLMPGMLHALGVPDKVVAECFVVEMDGDLDARLYVRGDSAMIEYNYFLKTRGKILQRLALEAEQGSYYHAKLYREWMMDNQREIVSRVSKPRQLNESGKAKAAIGSAFTQAPEPKSLPSAAENAAEPHEDSTGSDL